MEPEKKLTDQQIDDLLRNVEIPAELHAQLSQIPSDDSLPMPKANGHSSPRSRWFIALAAALLGVAMFMSWQMWPPEFAGLSPGQPSEPTDQERVDQPTERHPKIERLTDAEIASQRTELKIQLQQAELARLNARLQHLMRDANESRSVSRNDIDSLILVLADQTTLSLGGSNASVEDSMDFVLQRYPNSQGAELAKQFMRQ